MLPREDATPGQAERFAHAGRQAGRQLGGTSGTSEWDVELRFYVRGFGGIPSRALDSHHALGRSTPAVAAAAPCTAAQQHASSLSLFRSKGSRSLPTSFPVALPRTPGRTPGGLLWNVQVFVFGARSCLSSRTAGAESKVDPGAGRGRGSGSNLRVTKVSLSLPLALSLSCNK